MLNTPLRDRDRDRDRDRGDGNSIDTTHSNVSRYFKTLTVESMDFEEMESVMWRKVSSSYSLFVILSV